MSMEPWLVSTEQYPTEKTVFIVWARSPTEAVAKVLLDKCYRDDPPDPRPNIFWAAHMLEQGVCDVYSDRKYKAEWFNNAWDHEHAKMHKCPIDDSK